MERWPDDRSFIVQVFQYREVEAIKVVVVGAHFPHGHLWNLDGIDALGNEIRATGVEQVIFAADVNLEWWTSSASIMERLGVSSATGSRGFLSTELLHTCCKNDGFQHTYDRVITNFGESMKTSLLHDPLPWFAQTGTWAFHKGIVGEILLNTS